MMVNPVESGDTAPAAALAGQRLLALGGALAVVALWLVLQLWGLGKVPFHTRGETREGLVVWQITHGGGWILPLRDGPGGVEVPSKPPLFHWLGALTALVTGHTDEWSIRFPSAVMSLAGVLSTYVAGTALWGPSAGLVSATIVLTSFEWQRAATSARVDMTLTFGVTMASFAYLSFLRNGRRRWLVALYGGTALAVLAKGPVGVALPALLIAATCLVQRDVSSLRRLRLLHGLAAVAVIAGAWYVLALIEGGVSFFTKQILNENVFRLLSSAEYEGGHRHSALYLVGGLAAGFLPWTVFLPGPVAALWRRRRDLTASDSRVYFLSWIAVVFGVYSFAVSKRSVYLLSLYPALGLLVGGWWAAAIGGVEDEGTEDVAWLRAVVRMVALGGAALISVLCIGSAIECIGVSVIEWIGSRVSEEAAMYGAWVGAGLRQQPATSLSLLAVSTASLWWLAQAARASRRQSMFTAVAVTVAAASLLTQHVLLPGIAQRKTYREFMPAVRQVTGESAPPFFRTFEYAAVFYWGGHIDTYSGELTGDAPRYLLMAREEWERTTPAQREWFARVPLPASLEEGDRRRLVLVRKTR